MMTLKRQQTYHRVFHRIPKHYSNSISFFHPSGFKPSSKGIAPQIERSISDSVILVLWDDTSRLLVELYNHVVAWRLLVCDNPLRCSVTMLGHDTREVVSDSRFDQGGLYEKMKRLLRDSSHDQEKETRDIGVFNSLQKALEHNSLSIVPFLRPRHNQAASSESGDLREMVCKGT